MNKIPIETERLTIFSWPLVISEICCANRRFYVAYLKDEDFPVHVVTATVTEAVREFPPYLDWIETNAVQRRKGYARELVKAITNDLGHGDLAMDGATPEGDAFCGAICNFKQEN